MILQITKTCAINSNAVTGWSYNKDANVTTLFLHNKTTMAAKGDWNKYIVNAITKGAVWTDGKTIKLRQ